MPQEQAAEAQRTPPWLRVLVAGVVLAMGAGFGWLFSETGSGWLTGLIVAAPFAALGFWMPRLVVGVLVVFEVLGSCS